MPVIRFLGKVGPPALKLSLQNKTPIVIWKAPSHSLEGKTELQIVDGIVTATVDINKFDLNEHLRPVVNQALDMATAIMNVLSFHSGNPFVVSLDQIVLPDGETKDIYCKEVEFFKNVTAMSTGDDLEKVLQLVLTDRDLALAFRDLTEGVKQAYSGIIGCARAVETIRNYFIPEGAERDKGWAPMREALNATKPYVQSITAMSHGTRHGDWTTKDENEGRAAAERAWVLMNRFLEYRKRGDQRLPDTEFPLLDLSQA